jgi:putative membrane protein
LAAAVIQMPGARADLCTMKSVIRTALILGLGVIIVLIAREGVQTIVGLLSGAGWVLFLLVPLHAAPLLLDVLGWRVLIRGRCRLSSLYLIACIREAVSRLLPVASIGGELVGMRLLARQGVDGTTAASSVIVELAVTLASQFLFAVLGLACLLRFTDARRLSGELLFGLCAALLMLTVFIVLLRNGAIFSRLERAAERLLGLGSQVPAMLVHGARIDAAIRELLMARGRLARALIWQFAGLLLGCAETWLALRWLGHPVGFAAALVLESLTQAAKHVFFVVPAALGVQEAGLIGVGHLVGVGSDVAIALSMAKRMREIVFGLPALAAWSAWPLFKR